MCTGLPYRVSVLSVATAHRGRVGLSRGGAERLGPTFRTRIVRKRFYAADMIETDQD